MLVFAWLGDLLINRWLTLLLRYELLTPPGLVRGAADFAAMLAFNLASCLAVLVAMLALGRLILFSPSLPRGARAFTSGLALVFIPLALVGLCLHLPPTFDIYLRASFTALALIIGLAGMLAHEPVRVRCGLLLFAVPIVIRFGATLALACGGNGDTVMMWIRLGQGMAALAPVAGLALLAPAKARWRWPLVAGGLAAAGAMTLVFFDWELAARLAVYGFGMELPLTWSGTTAFSLSLGAWVALAMSLTVSGGAERLRGLSIALIGLTGFHLEQAGQLGAALTGLMGILFSFSWVAGETRENWHTFLRSLAGAVGARDVTKGGNHGREEARLYFKIEEESFALMVTRRRGVLREIELICGLAPEHAPPLLSLTRRGSDRLGPSDGKLITIGDLAFDEAFRVYDARQLAGADPILTDDLRPRMLGLIDGWLGIWPGEGACYRCRYPRYLAEEGGMARLLELAALLMDIKRRQ